jgi:hypothetical protein
VDSERFQHFAGRVGNSNTTGTAQANGNYGTYQGSTNIISPLAEGYFEEAVKALLTQYDLDKPVRPSSLARAPKD